MTDPDPLSSTASTAAADAVAGGCRSGSGSRAVDQADVRDPVCGMSVEPATAAHHATHAGQDYHFCSAGCRMKFIADPNQYLAATPAPVAQAMAGAIWTCPMHPQIRRPGPGTCPICGMALEPEAPSLDDGPNPELVDFTRRWWVSAVLSVPLLVLTMVTDLFKLHLVSPAISQWVQLALAAPIVLWAGAPFFVRGWTSLKTRHRSIMRRREWSWRSCCSAKCSNCAPAPRRARQSARCSTWRRRPRGGSGPTAARPKCRLPK